MKSLAMICSGSLVILIPAVVVSVVSTSLDDVSKDVLWPVAPADVNSIPNNKHESKGIRYYSVYTCTPVHVL